MAQPIQAVLPKKIIRESRMDSTVTEIVPQEKIKDLPSTISIFQNSIPNFNTHVKHIVVDLVARVKNTPDLTDHLI